MSKKNAPAVLDTSKFQNVIATVLFTRGKYQHFRTEGNDYLNIMRAAGGKFFSNFQGIYVEFEALQANILML